jgi:hypothetical protein
MTFFNDLLRMLKEEWNLISFQITDPQLHGTWLPENMQSQNEKVAAASCTSANLIKL